MNRIGKFVLSNKFWKKMDWDWTFKFKTFNARNILKKFGDKGICGGSTLIAAGLLMHDIKSEDLVDWTSDNYKKVSQSTMNKLIEILIFRPRPKDVKYTKSLLAIQVMEPSKEQYDVFIKAVESNTDLMTVAGRDDIIYILETLKHIHGNMLLDIVDCIQICMGEHELLRIENINNNNGRLVYIDINTVRMNLIKLLDTRCV